MKIIWTPRASRDLKQAFEYILADNPSAAERVVGRIYQRLMALALTPYIGRPGLLLGTEEIVFHPWPYIAVYRVDNEAIRILRVRHSSQRWP